MKSAKRSESMESEKNEVKDCGENIIKGKLWMANNKKKAVPIYPPIIILL